MAFAPARSGRPPKDDRRAPADERCRSRVRIFSTFCANRYDLAAVGREGASRFGWKCDAIVTPGVMQLAFEPRSDRL